MSLPFQQKEVILHSVVSIISDPQMDSFTEDALSGILSRPYTITHEPASITVESVRSQLHIQIRTGSK